LAEGLEQELGLVVWGYHRHSRQLQLEPSPLPGGCQRKSDVAAPGFRPVQPFPGARTPSVAHTFRWANPWKSFRLTRTFLEKVGVRIASAVILGKSELPPEPFLVLIRLIRW